MRRLITFCAAAVLILATGSAHADLTNPSFETGNLTGRVQVLIFREEVRRNGTDETARLQILA